MEDSNQPLTKQDWLEAARIALAQQGVKGVKVEVLARHLGVSKGSFYWHFKNRDALLQDLLAYWAQSTDLLIEQASGKVTPKAQLEHLFTAINKLGVTGEDAIHTWAKHDTTVAQHLRAVEAKRLDFLTSLFRQQGFSSVEAQERAEICYLTFLGYVFKTGQDTPSLSQLDELGSKITALLMHKES
ncbi:MAG: TetR/AcrR family transcriptional regulator [Deinococcota bacterium]